MYDDADFMKVISQRSVGIKFRQWMNFIRGKSNTSKLIVVAVIFYILFIAPDYLLI